jgi:gp16 family phage-associated protein
MNEIVPQTHNFDVSTTSKKPKKPAQVKKEFARHGKTFTQWAAEHGYRRSDVYRVLNGQLKGHYGLSHEIALKLGLKTED